MTSQWYESFHTWNNTPDEEREKIHRDTDLADIKSEEDLLKMTVVIHSFKCHLCPKIFPVPDQLTNHIKRFHKKTGCPE